MKRFSKKKYLKYLKSGRWKQLRIKLKYQRGFACENCGVKGKLVTHHLTYDRVFHERLSDLQVLCEKCHGYTHSQKTEELYMRAKHEQTKRKNRILTNLRPEHAEALDKYWNFGTALKDMVLYERIAIALCEAIGKDS
ncbi:MAG: hypothetical protein GY757_18760 [bacterium]|nr:hypothetical protein [bacterium]